jgi:hypothetical protein
VVADRRAEAAHVGDGPGACGAGGIRGTRVEGKESTGVSKGGKWAQRESFENTRDLLGDLLGAKNASVTPPGHAAEPQRRRDPDPNQAPKPVAGESLVILPTFPGLPVPPARRISAGTAAGRPGGPNCESPVISRASSAK